ncbi:MAG: Hpt domain-containing protein [Phyllobacterium sp.]
MALQNKELAAFSLPGGETSCPSRQRPVDLVHLMRQTMGDRALETEILSMFSRQAAALAEKLGEAKGKDRVILAHTLKGSARSVGAFEVSRHAEKLESDPGNASAMKALIGALRDVQEFIAAISR